MSRRRGARTLKRQRELQVQPMSLFGGWPVGAKQLGQKPCDFIWPLTMMAKNPVNSHRPGAFVAEQIIVVRHKSGFD